MNRYFEWRKDAAEILDPEDYLGQAKITALARIEYAEQQLEAFKWSISDVMSDTRDRGGQVEYDNLIRALYGYMNEAYRDFFMYVSLAPTEEDRELAKLLAFRRFLHRRYSLQHMLGTSSAYAPSSWQNDSKLREAVDSLVGEDGEIDRDRMLLEYKLSDAIDQIGMLVRRVDEAERSEQKMRERYEAVVGAFTEHEPEKEG